VESMVFPILRKLLATVTFIFSHLSMVVTFETADTKTVQLTQLIMETKLTQASI